MTSSIKHLISQFNLQTRLFNNVTSGVSDTDSLQHLNENTNKIAWPTGHTVSTRYMLANVLGMQEQEPYPALFANGKGFDKTAQYPSMAALTKDWNAISTKMVSALGSLTEEKLDAKGPFPVPTGETIGDLISFFAHHEAYTIGQLGIARRYFGLEAMKYS